jgi:DNA-binding response OmpR family regulator
MQVIRSGRKHRSLHGSRILVVESEPLIAAWIKEELLYAGAIVPDVIHNAGEALSASENGGPGTIDAAVVSLDRGRMSRRVIAALALRNIPCVVTTFGFEPLEGLEQIPLLCKPFNDQRLVELLTTELQLAANLSHRYRSMFQSAHSDLPHL